MNSNETKYIQWESEVSEYLNSLNQKLLNSPEASELYNGFYIWDSEIKFNPKIMFIGINPGNGNPNNNRSVTTAPYESFAYLEYWNLKSHNYTLARETIEIFKEIGYNEKQIRHIFEMESVKTNYFYIITKNQPLIYECLNKVDEYINFRIKSDKFIKELIELINPKIIICEGKSVFNEVKRIYNSTIDQIEWQDNCGKANLKAGLTCYGYSRMYSQIRNKDRFKELIKPHLMELIPIS